jgi:NAD(P)-dependent dehydrogenase (short-subunit alcohol dehydrogenase family)
MHVMNRLNGKTAVITGGATGIGRAAAKRFIDEGAFVFIFGRRQKELDAALASLGPNARAVKGSVSDLADLDRLYAAVKAERGTLDIVFANAGAGSQLRLGEITAEHIDETFDTNVKGTIFTVQKALPLMGKGGSIILTGSSAGTTGAPAMSAYSASKAAVRNLARTWAEDLKRGHPGKRAVARRDGDRTREGSAWRGGPEGLRLDDSAPAHGRSGGDRGGGCLSRLVGQQLHDGQRARCRRRPSATLTPARSRASRALKRRQHRTKDKRS